MQTACYLIETRYLYISRCRNETRNILREGEICWTMTLNISTNISTTQPLGVSVRERASERERSEEAGRERGGWLICFMSAPSSPRSAYQELTTLGAQGGQSSNAARPLFTPSQQQQQQRGNDTMGYPAASSSQQNFEDLRSLQGQADSMRDEAQVRRSCSLPHSLHPFSALFFLCV